MGLTIAVGLAFFLGLMAILYFGHEQAEKDRAERAAAEARRAPRGDLVGRTADEVVFDLEHRIDADLQDVAAAAGRAAAPDGAAHSHQG